MRIALALIIIIAGVGIGSNLIKQVEQMTESRNGQLCQVDPSYCNE
jgi:tRNA A37 threonylcarbamoyltransferase TsaD